MAPHSSYILSRGWAAVCVGLTLQCDAQECVSAPCGKSRALHCVVLYLFYFILLFVSPEEYDELEHLVTSQTESVNIDHPNHIVTVTTISDLDLSGARQLGLTTPEVQPLAAFSIASALNILGAD